MEITELLRRTEGRTAFATTTGGFILIGNAVAHADYSLRGAPIRLAVFDDRIEVYNPACSGSG